MIKQKIICLVGPSGIGKTALSINLAKEFHGEIISADSMQIYKDMNIGTAKITSEEMQGVPHHIIDIVSPLDNFSVSDWKALAEKHIKEIALRRKTPFIVGGTGLYVSSLLYDYNFSSVGQDIQIREHYQKYLEEKGSEALHNLLQEKDPKKAESIHPNKTKAVIRALEVFDITQRRENANAEESVVANTDTPESKYDFLLLGLTMDRAMLYDRINLRVDKMFEEGLVNEFDRLIEKYGLESTHQSALAIGYRELFALKSGDMTKEECSELIKKDTRNYAKRQLTWFRRMKDIEWFEPTDTENIIKRIRGFLYENNQ